jgi:hypothetical protein
MKKSVCPDRRKWELGELGWDKTKLRYLPKIAQPINKPRLVSQSGVTWLPAQSTARPRYT